MTPEQRRRSRDRDRRPDHRDDHTLELAQTLDSAQRSGLNAALILRRALAKPLPEEKTTEQQAPTEAVTASRSDAVSAASTPSTALASPAGAVFVQSHRSTSSGTNAGLGVIR